jgi:hypothetical protein
MNVCSYIHKFSVWSHAYTHMLRELSSMESTCTSLCMTIHGCGNNTNNCMRFCHSSTTIHIHVCVCTSIHTYTCMCLYKHAHIHMYVSVQPHTHTHTCMCLYNHTHTLMHTHSLMCQCLHTHTTKHIHSCSCRLHLARRYTPYICVCTHSNNPRTYHTHM